MKISNVSPFIGFFFLFACNLSIEKETTPTLEKSSKQEVKEVVLSPKEELMSVWMFQKLKPYKESKEVNLEDELLYLQTNYGHLHLFSDHSMVLRNIELMEIGSWKYKTGKKVLVLEGPVQKDSFKIIQINHFNEDLVTVEMIHHKQYKVIMTQIRPFAENQLDEPFHPINNAWRFPPNRPETDKEIMIRLRNHVHQNALILKEAIDFEYDRIDFSDSDGPLKYYQGVVGCMQREKISSMYIDGFYNKGQAMKSIDFLQDVIVRTTYPENNTDNWVEDDYEILKAYVQTLDALIKKNPEA